MNIESYIAEDNIFKTYPEANNTELSSDGFLFGRVIQDVMEINTNGKVKLKTIIYNKFMPLSNFDVDEDIFEKKYPTKYGTVSINDNGLLQFVFEDFDLVGYPLKEETNKVVFHGYNKIVKLHFSILY